MPQGEWYRNNAFLETADTSIATAEWLLQLHRQAMANLTFAEAVHSNWLQPAVAPLLARPSTPLAILATPTPLTDTAIADLSRTAKAANDYPIP